MHSGNGSKLNDAFTQLLGVDDWTPANLNDYIRALLKSGLGAHTEEFLDMGSPDIDALIKTIFGQIGGGEFIEGLDSAHANFMNLINKLDAHFKSPVPTEYTYRKTDWEKFKQLLREHKESNEDGLSQTESLNVSRPSVDDAGADLQSSDAKSSFRFLMLILGFDIINKSTQEEAFYLLFSIIRGTSTVDPKFLQLLSLLAQGIMPNNPGGFVGSLEDFQGSCRENLRLNEHNMSRFADLLKLFETKRNSFPLILKGSSGALLLMGLLAAKFDLVISGVDYSREVKVTDSFSVTIRDILMMGVSALALLEATGQSIAVACRDNKPFTFSANHFKYYLRAMSLDFYAHFFSNVINWGRSMISEQMNEINDNPGKFTFIKSVRHILSAVCVEFRDALVKRGLVASIVTSSAMSLSVLYSNKIFDMVLENESLQSLFGLFANVGKRSEGADFVFMLTGPFVLMGISLALTDSMYLACNTQLPKFLKKGNMVAMLCAFSFLSYFAFAICEIFQLAGDALPQNNLTKYLKFVDEFNEYGGNLTLAFNSVPAVKGPALVYATFLQFASWLAGLYSIIRCCKGMDPCKTGENFLSDFIREFVRLIVDLVSLYLSTFDPRSRSPDELKEKFLSFISSASGCCQLPDCSTICAAGGMFGGVSPSTVYDMEQPLMSDDPEGGDSTSTLPPNGNDSERDAFKTADTGEAAEEISGIGRRPHS